MTLARFLLALLASAATVAYAEDLTVIGPGAGDDCCPKGEFCCGESCVDDELAPVILCIFSEVGCCGPKPKPLPDDCCPKGKFCCGDSCLDDSQQPLVRCRRDTCCKPEPKPEPEDCCDDGDFCCDGACLKIGTPTFAACGDKPCCPKQDDPPPVESCCKSEGACCDGQTCCGGECVDSSTLEPDTLCTEQACCVSNGDKEECCAEKERVCCDGSCFPPGTAFFAPCESNLCGCPDEADPPPKPLPTPTPLPKPLPKPVPKPLPLPDDCCGSGKVCCGRNCINQRLQPFLKCIQIADGCC